MKYVNWLHLTDLHFGQSSQDWLWPGLRDEFKKDLRKVHEVAGPWHIVFFSGDLTQCAEQDQFAALENELKQLWDFFGKLGSNPVLAVVPGNHDLVRPPSSSAALRALHQWQQDDVIQRAFWEDETSEYRQLVAAAFANYVEWCGNTELPLITPAQPGLLPGDFSAVCVGSGLKLGVIGVNSAFLQLEGGDYEKRIAVHPRQIVQACGGDLPLWCKDVDVAFLVSHHGPGWLADQELTTYQADFYPPERFFCHLYGHLHESKTEDISQGGSVPRRLRQAPSLFGLKNWGESNERLHGYTAGRIEIGSDIGHEYLWPRILTKKLHGAWSLSPDTRYDLTENNAVVTAFTPQSPSSEVCQRTHPIEKKGAPSAPDDDTSDGATEDETALPLSVFETPHTDADKARKSLKNVPRFRLPPPAQHSGIRLDAQETATRSLREHRCVWIACDWGLGKDEFLAVVAGVVAPTGSGSDVYRIDCEDVTDRESLLTACQDQLGLQLQAFCAQILDLPFSLLVFDGVGDAFLADGEKDQRYRSRDEILQALLDYCPTMSIALVSRDLPSQLPCPSVELQPLDVPEVRAYITGHPEHQPNLEDAETIEVLHARSGGVPMHLDALLRDLRFISIHDLMESELERPVTDAVDSEPVPKALKQAIAALATSPDRYRKRSFLLLKVLTALPNGETFGAIRRFYPTEPFYTANVEDLTRLHLLDVTSVVDPTPEMRSKGGFSAKGAAELPKLLRVPRQVQAYVRSLMDDDELAETMETAADLAFGRRWRDGKIRLRPLHLDSAGQRIYGSGNEHLIARYLVWSALQHGRKRIVRRAARAAIGYCRKLIAADRYRDAAIATEDLYHLLEGTEFQREFSSLGQIRGEALRMIGKRKEALQILNHTVEIGSSLLTRDALASVHLDIALAHESLGEKDQAVLAARRVQELSKDHSSKYLQAAATIAECRLSGDELVESLKDLESRARAQNLNDLGNTIALMLARYDRGHALKHNERVLTNKGNLYNRIRAVTNKASELVKSGDITTLPPAERVLLGISYSYLHSQRLAALFSRCHRAIWSLLLHEGMIPQLLRLFRHSSFVWRIQGKEKEEGIYLQSLEEMVPIGTGTPQGDRDDFAYFVRRKGVLSLPPPSDASSEAREGC